MIKKHITIIILVTGVITPDDIIIVSEKVIL